MRCHRCGQPMTLYVVGDDYCRQCVRDLATRAPKPAPEKPLWMRRLRAKDMTPYGGAA